MRLTVVRILRAALPILFGAAAAVAQNAAAQMRAEAIPDAVLRPYSVRESNAMPPPEAAPRIAGTVSTEPQLRDYSWLGGAVQVEGPRQTLTGTYTRPRVIIGVPSEPMKDWMNSAGLPVEQCLLPMLRARARVSAEGEASGTMWVYARCTFQ
jgi:hypothetical protein